MNIQKAIEIKEQYLQDNQPYDLKELEEADRLSIKALSAYQVLRFSKIIAPTLLLPGETE